MTQIPCEHLLNISQEKMCALEHQMMLSLPRNDKQSSKTATDRATANHIQKNAQVTGVFLLVLAPHSTMAATQQHESAPPRQEILTLFHQITDNQTECQPDILQLIRLIGGIEVVMNHMLHSSDHMFTDEQLTAMHQYLSGLSSSGSSQTDVLAKEDVIKSNILKNDLQWTLDPDNNTLHQRFPFIEKIVFSKWTCLFGAMVAILWIVAILFYSYWLILFCFLMNVLSIPMLIAYLLAINKMMIPQIIRSFDAWVKVGTGAMWAIYSALYWMILDIRDGDRLNLLTWFVLIVGGITLVLFMMLVSSLDGMHQWGRKARILFTVPCTVLFVFIYVFGFFIFEEVTIKIPQFGDYGVFYIRERLLNSYYVLSLFLAKQAFNDWRLKNQCVVITCRPFIKWEEPMFPQNAVEMKTERVHVSAYSKDVDSPAMTSFATIRSEDIDTVWLLTMTDLFGHCMQMNQKSLS